jgi:putative Mg2+ transporter-C (MgtC) family protein
MCLAATGAMIEANLMLSVVGKTPQSFTIMDALRFPLGILSGIGFIGAGAIIRRNNIVTGVTTAATMWIMTVIGLVLGAGYFALGGVLTAVVFVVLSVLKTLEEYLRREQRGSLTIDIGGDGPSDRELREAIELAGFRLKSYATEYGVIRSVHCMMTWYSADAPIEPPPLIGALAARAGVIRVKWQPMEAGHLSD